LLILSLSLTLSYSSSFNFSLVNLNRLLFVIRIFFITGIATLLELLSEPFYIMIQNQLLFRVRVMVEATAVFFRCVITFILVFYCEVILYQMLNLSFSFTLFFFLFFGLVLFCFDDTNHKTTVVEVTSLYSLRHLNSFSFSVRTLIFCFGSNMLCIDSHRGILCLFRSSNTNKEEIWYSSVEISETTLSSN
jgi:hypothetical protein